MNYSVVLPASDSHRYVIDGIMLRAADYHQIMCWATALEKTPEEIIHTLKHTSIQRVGLTVVDGAIKTLAWDGAALPLDHFDWQPQLSIDTLAISKQAPCLKATRQLPSLRRLRVAGCGLSALEVAAFPNLRHLDCRGNRLVQLQLDDVPQLEELLCCSNLLTTLRLSSVPALHTLNCSKNRRLDVSISDALRLQRFYCDLGQLKLVAEAAAA